MFHGPVSIIPYKKSKVKTQDDQTASWGWCVSTVGSWCMKDGLIQVCSCYYSVYRSTTTMQPST